MSAERTTYANNGAQPLTHRKQYSYEFTSRQSSYQFRDDFELYTSIPASGSRANGTPWVQKIVGAAPPVLSLVADGAHGIVSSAMTSDSQKQEATIHWDNNRHWDIAAGGGIFQATAQLSVLPTGAGECGLGLIGDWVDGGITGSTYCAGFILDAAGAVSIAIDDNATPTTASTGVTMTVSTWYVFRIDFSDLTNVKYFINGAYVNGSTVMPYAATGANAVLQPYFGCYKASGTGVGTGLLQRTSFWND